MSQALSVCRYALQTSTKFPLRIWLAMPTLCRYTISLSGKSATNVPFRCTRLTTHHNHHPHCNSGVFGAPMPTFVFAPPTRTRQNSVLVTTRFHLPEVHSPAVYYPSI